MRVGEKHSTPGRLVGGRVALPHVGQGRRSARTKCPTGTEALGVEIQFVLANSGSAPAEAISLRVAVAG
jgi:hypothetical protein